MSEKCFDIAIIGSGAAGSMGALRAVLNNLDTVCFMGNAQSKKKARATWVGEVENMPVLFNKPKAIFQSAAEVFQWIESKEEWSQQLTSVKDSVTKIEGSSGNFKLYTSKNEVFSAKYVVICTGIMDIQPEIQGDISPIFPMANAGHIDYCIRCDGHRSKGKATAIIGHSSEAPWIAALLKERYDNPMMSVLSNGKTLDLEKNSTIGKRLDLYGIKTYQSPIKEILGNPKENGLEGFLLEDGTRVEAQMAYVSMGTLVYNELATGIGCEIDDRGYVLTDESGETNIPGIFAAGDLRANKKKQIYTAWDTTVDSVDKVDSYIRKEKRERNFPA